MILIIDTRCIHIRMKSFFSGVSKQIPLEIHSSSDNSRISTSAMYNILDRLKRNRNRQSTKDNYFTIWRLFNRFVLKLDNIPDNWEDRVYLFLTNLTYEGKQSSTIRSYLSAIRAILWDNQYELKNNELELKAITRMCKLTYDIVQQREPVRLPLLEMMLFEFGRMFKDQPYLLTMYRTLICIAYYGLFRIDELAKGDHAVLAKDVEIATNKQKVKLTLHIKDTWSLYQTARNQNIVTV